MKMVYHKTEKIQPIINLFYFISENVDELIRNYSSLTVREAANTECPFMFISFPSAKDPSWDEKYPGKYFDRIPFTSVQPCNRFDMLDISY